MTKTLSILLLSSLFVFLSGSCSKTSYQQVYPTLSDGKYDSEFPYRQCTEELSKIVKSVRKVISNAEYLTYIMDEESKLTLKNLDFDHLDKYATRKEFSNDSKSATATLIYKSGRKLAFLTCAHAITYQDKIISYYEPLYPGAEPYIFSVSVKTRQNYYVMGEAKGFEVEVLIDNKEDDIAILGVEMEGDDMIAGIPVLKYPVGQAKQLEWGSFVYIIGYPKGLQMITKGIVSSPDRDKKGSFLIDALFNEGFSGGIILAIRDGVPNFELVGIVKSVSATTDYIVVPLAPNHDVAYNPNISYTGDLKLHRKKDINYGICFAVSTELITDFIKKSEKELLDKQFNISSFFEE